MPQSAYQEKFSDFINLLATTSESVIMIHHPQVLGDSHDEIVESLNRISDAGKSLVIVPTKQRG